MKIFTNLRKATRHWTTNTFRQKTFVRTRANILRSSSIHNPAQVPSASAPISQVKPDEVELDKVESDKVEPDKMEPDK